MPALFFFARPLGRVDVVVPGATRGVAPGLTPLPRWHLLS
jgi:hypothetical protein